MRQKYPTLILTLIVSITTLDAISLANLDMPRITFPLNKRKTIAVAEHLLNNLGGKNNFMYLLKLTFFADRFHVRQYLRPATGDRYFAMPFGAVASYLDNVFTGKIQSDIITPIGNHVVVLNGNGEQFKDELSPSDIEAVNFSLSNFAQYGRFELADLTHAYPEWKKYEQVLTSGQSKRENMYFDDFLLNADPTDPMFTKYEFADPYPIIKEEERLTMEAELLEISNQTA